MAGKPCGVALVAVLLSAHVAVGCGAGRAQVPPPPDAPAGGSSRTASLADSDQDAGAAPAVAPDSTTIADAPPLTDTPPSGRAPASGLYEAWSPILMAPAGLLAEAPTLLPQWLRVSTTGDASTVTFQPEGRVVWRLTYGPPGLIEKVAEVDGRTWTRSVFTYGEQGRIARKSVTGPGAVPTLPPASFWNESPCTDVPGVCPRWPGLPETLEFEYRTDPQGRVVARTGTLIRRMPSGSQNIPPYVFTERWLVDWEERQVTATLHLGDTLARRDVFDAQGRLLETTFAPASGGRLVLRYKRDDEGRLTGVTRTLGTARPAPADFRTRVESVGPSELGRLDDSFIEEGEARLLLGSPVTRTDEGQGIERRIDDSYVEGCALNLPSDLEFDAAGLLISTITNCVCGYCVDASLPVAAEEVRAVMLHWTPGPWVRLDGAIDVTAEHEVMTPAGPRAARTLRAGDLVLGADGGIRELGDVKLLPPGDRRLGRNVVTASGVFSAGGIVFRSERPRPCTEAPGPSPQAGGGTASGLTRPPSSLR